MAAYCKLPGCDWMTGEPVRDIAGCLAAWHVYEDHPEVWRELFGSRPPVDPDPRIPEVRMALSVLSGSN